MEASPRVARTYRSGRKVLIGSLSIPKAPCDRQHLLRSGKVRDFLPSNGYSFDLSVGERIIVRRECRPENHDEWHCDYLVWPSLIPATKLGKGRYQWEEDGQAIETEPGLLRRWREDVAFQERRIAEMREVAKRPEVREKHRAAGKRIHAANPAFMPKIAKMHLEDPEVNARWRKAHKEAISTPEYRQSLSDAQKRVREQYPHLKESARQRMKDRWSNINALTRAGWRPADWHTKPIDWRIIGNELLSEPYISNIELGRRLDSSRLLDCPYGEEPRSWKKALSSNKATLNRAAIKLVNEVRKWVGRQGKIAVSKNPVNHDSSSPGEPS